MKGIQAEIYLLIIVIIWGSTFALIKGVIDTIPPYTYLAYRFLLAALILVVIFWKRLKKLNIMILKKGSLIGIFLFLGYTLQTVGLKYTTATKAGFITGFSVVLVPIISFLLLKEKVSRDSVIGVVLATLGLWFLNYNSSFSFNLGDFLVLLCAFSFAMHIISVGLFSKKLDYVLLAITQITVVFILSLFMALIFERPAIHFSYSSDIWWSILITGIFATALAFYMQNRFQRHSTATKTAIIFSGEPLFAAIFAYILIREKVGLIAWAGGLLIIFGMIISQKESAR